MRCAFTAIHGAALGGGLEVALGCAWRIAARSARWGFPEVTLGLVPGAGGTVRLPRLVEPESAVWLVTSGKPVNASEVLELGLIDAVAGEKVRADAIRFTRVRVDQPRPEALTRRSPVGSPGEKFWRTQHAAIATRARPGFAAPGTECVRRAVENAAEDAFAQERETFFELRASKQAKALRHVFFAERAATKPPELTDVEPRAVGSVGVVGGGTMGAGIAVALGHAGLPVVLIERDDESLERGRANVTRILDGAVKRGRLDVVARDARLAAERVSRGDDGGRLVLILQMGDHRADRGACLHVLIVHARDEARDPAEVGVPVSVFGERGTAEGDDHGVRGALVPDAKV